MRRNRYIAERKLEEFTNRLRIIGQKFSNHKSEESRKAKKRMFDFVPNEKDLTDLSSTVMSHICSDKTCTKKGPCKAGFPKDEFPRAKCVYSQTINKKTKEKTTYLSIEVARSEDSKQTNNYHMLVLCLWRANTDMKVVVCMKSILRYCAKYVTKPECPSIPMTQTINMFAEEHKKVPKDYTAFVGVQKIFNKYLG